MLKSLFNYKSNHRKEEILAPLSGDVIPLSEVPDPVFSQKMMGDGIAIIPNNGKVVSPVNGQVMQIFPTKHAIGIHSERGLEVLIHIGLETVALNGKGFEVLIHNGQQVKAGEPLVNVDLDYLKSNNKETITPIIITNMETVLEIESNDKQKTNLGEVLLKCIMK